MTPGIPPLGTPVLGTENLRRAVWPSKMDDRGRPTSEAFRAPKHPDLSVDVASLAPLADTQGRFPTSFIVVVRCQVFIDVGHEPFHTPTAANPSHATVPGPITKLHRRRLAISVHHVYRPIPH